MLFNGYRREGHQFDITVYNKLLFGWVAMVSFFNYIIIIIAKTALIGCFVGFDINIVLCAKMVFW